MKPFFLYILVFIGIVTPLAAQDNCYQDLRAKGLALLKNKDYRKAVDKFFAARYCPDKPAKDDLDDLIKNTQDKWVNALDNAVKNANIAQQKTKAALAKADSSLALANSIINAFYFYKDSFALAYKNGYYGFINKKGEAVIDYEYKEALPFDITGYARVKRLDVLYLIDTKGVEYRLATELNQLDSGVVALDLRDRRLDTFPMAILERPQLKILLLSSNRFTRLPQGLGELINLQHLDLSINSLTSLPASIGQLKNLQILELSYNRLQSLPESIGELHHIQNLDLTGSALRGLPESFGELRQLQTLKLTYNPLTNFPTVISKLHNLQVLNLHRSHLTSLPEEIEQLRNLRALNLSFNELERLPESIGQLSNLETLELFENKLVNLPESIGQLRNLQLLVLYKNPLERLPESIGQLGNLRTLSLSSSLITSLPESIFQLKKLQNLYLSGNQIKRLPEKIGQLSNLQRLSLSSNELTTIPESIGQLSKLKSLEIAINLLSNLPASIGQLSKLDTLDLTYNNLKNLPASISQLKQLGMLDLTHNPIILPELRKLPPRLYIDQLLEYAADFIYDEDYAVALTNYQELASLNIDTIVKQDAAANCSNITWNLLLQKQFKLALEAGLLARRFDATNANLYTNLPLAYLFNDQFEKAKVIYLAYKDKMYNEEESYRVIFLKDFADLEARGITHPAIARIKALLGE